VLANGKLMVVDLGYIQGPFCTPEQAKATVARAEQLEAAGIGKSNFSCAGQDNMRLIVRIPPRKAKKILNQFPIKRKETYYGIPYSWLS